MAQKVRVFGLPLLKIKPRDTSQDFGVSFLPTDSVKLLELYDTWYWKVDYKGRIGYISDRDLTKDSVYHKILATKKPIKFIDNTQIAEDKAELAVMTKKYGASWATLIVAEKIKIGMTKAMVKDSWGEPEDINRTVGSWGVHEQWVYGSNYLYFENGKLTSWQD